MRYKKLKIWLRKKGLLCRKYKYTIPSKLKISHTIYPNGIGKQYDRNGQEFYGIVKEDIHEPIRDTSRVEAIERHKKKLGQ